MVSYISSLTVILGRSGCNEMMLDEVFADANN